MAASGRSTAPAKQVAVWDMRLKIRVKSVQESPPPREWTHTQVLVHAHYDSTLAFPKSFFLSHKSFHGKLQGESGVHTHASDYTRLK